MGTVDDALVDAVDEVVPARPRPASWADAVPRLRVAVRALSFDPAPAGAVPLRRPLVPFVVAQVAIDDEVADLTVTPADLAAWNVDEEQVWEAARDNVLAAELPIAPSALAPNAFDVVGPERFVSSWLTIPDAVALAGEQVAGATLVVAPTTDRLVILGDADRHAVARVLDWAFDEYQQSARQLSPLPYVVDGDTVRPWRPDASGASASPAVSDPCAVKVGRAERILAAVEYAAQQQALDEFFVDAGEEIFAASLFVRERDDGSVWTFASWVLDVDSVLPAADYVAVVAGAGDQFMVRWDDALVAAASVLERVPALDPPRWRAPELPPAAVTDALRALEVDPTAP